MSYLNSLRFHFAGQFQAAPSTVNNDSANYDNETFDPSNGFWNPAGDAVWRLIGCKVTSARANNAAVPATDPIHEYLIADSDTRVAGKLVDLDPEQQLVSQIWGLQVRICDANGHSILQADYQTAPFNDIWNRALAAGHAGDMAFGAAYCSVLHNLKWGATESSPFLTALRSASAGSGKLSIKFNVDGYNTLATSEHFTLGRIVGTIGPGLEGEPDYLVNGRHLSVSTGTPNLNFCPAVVSPGEGKIYLDLGNSMPTSAPAGPVPALGTLTLGYATTTAITVIDAIDYQDAQWYETTAGVVEIPASRKLTDAELTAVASNPLVLALATAAGPAAAGISEPADGLYCRADGFVFRANPGETIETNVYASRYGQPYAGARIVNILDASQLQPSDLAVGVPTSAVDFDGRVVADKNGVAKLRIRVSDPGHPRSYVDGQVYGIRPIIEDTLAFGSGDTYNPGDFISLLAFSGFTAPDPPVWNGCLQPIFQQYANLYPVMKRFLDMADYESVCANVKLLKLAFSLPPGDPNSMPVTRDLSAAKREAILRWLHAPGPDGKPLLGEAPPVMKAANVQPTAKQPQQRGKAAAASRRLFLQPRR